MTDIILISELIDGTQQAFETNKPNLCNEIVDYCGISKKNYILLNIVISTKNPKWFKI